MICLSIVSSRLHFFHNVNVLQKKKGVILMFSILSYLTFLFLLCNLRCNTHSRTLLVVSGRRPSPIFLVTLLNNCSFPSLNHLSSSHVAPSFLSQLWPWGKEASVIHSISINGVFVFIPHSGALYAFSPSLLLFSCSVVSDSL